MSQDLFPASGPGGGVSWPEDDWDPDASLDSLVAAIESGEYEEPGEGPEQGLFVCLPPDQVTLSGFAQHGTADTMEPGALLAAVVDAVAGEEGQGLAALSENQLVGVISAARRLECRAAWAQLAATAAFAARRPASGKASGVSEFAADELAAELRLSWMSAAGQLAYATDVAGRLPRSFAALAAGRLHPVHLRIIADEASVLSAEDAARADEVLAGLAGSKTFAQLRYAAHRLVLKLDPEAAHRRKEEAKKDACVRRFREASGNGGLAARELPPDEVLASWQHVEQRALDLRAAGVPGTLQELRVRAYLDLLQERDARATPAGLPERDHDAPGSPGGETGPGGGDGLDGPGRSRGPGGGPDDPGGPGAARPASPSRGTPAPGPGLAALVTITVPLATWQGRSAEPGQAAGFGLLDADDTRDLIAAAARHPATRWCLTALHPDGTAAAHACAPGRHPITPTSGRHPITPTPAPDRSPAAAPGTRAGPGPPPVPGGLPAVIVQGLRDRLAAIARDQCDHRHAEAGYRPSRKLAHLIAARNTKCTAPGCGRPAARCDLDHTVAWQDGGLTCECNISPLCRHHHRCKQSDGWRLEQPEPGVLVWRTPAGRSYTTGPTCYSG